MPESRPGPIDTPAEPGFRNTPRTMVAREGMADRETMRRPLDDRDRARLAKMRALSRPDPDPDTPHLHTPPSGKPQP